MTVVPDLPPLAFLLLFFFVDFFPLGDGDGARGEQTSALDACLSILYTLNHASLPPPLYITPEAVIHQIILSPISSLFFLSHPVRSVIDR